MVEPKEERKHQEPAVTAGRGAIVIEERLRIPEDVFTVERFCDWAHSPEFPQSGWVSFIGGEIEIEMSPEEIETHNKVKVCLATGLSIWIDPRDLGELLGDRAFLVNEAAELATEPDLLFCTWESLRAGRVGYRERVKGSKRYVEVTGAPDLVVEVVSDTSERKDKKLLLVRYFRAGIREYWLVDARGKEIDFTLFRRGGENYVAVPTDADGYCRSEVLGGSFRLVRGLNPVGGYAYRLLSRV